MGKRQWTCCLVYPSPHPLSCRLAQKPSNSSLDSTRLFSPLLKALHRLSMSSLHHLPNFAAITLAFSLFFYHANHLLPQMPYIWCSFRIEWWLLIEYGTSLVAQWLRILLPTQETRVRALVQEDPTCRRATKPVCHNYWACALEPASHNYWAHVPQLLSPRATTTEAHVPSAHAPQQEKPPQWEAHAPQRRVAPARHN